MSFEHDPSKKHLGHMRGRVARTVPPGGRPRLPTPRAYPCSTCGARPGQSCIRKNGGSYDKPMRSFHDERRKAVAS